MKISNNLEYDEAKKRWNEIRDIHVDGPLAKEFDELVDAIYEYEKTLPESVKPAGVIEAEKQYEDMSESDKADYESFDKWNGSTV